MLVISRAEGRVTDIKSPCASPREPWFMVLFIRLKIHGVPKESLIKLHHGYRKLLSKASSRDNIKTKTEEVLLSFSFVNKNKPFIANWVVMYILQLAAHQSLCFDFIFNVEKYIKYF